MSQDRMKGRKANARAFRPALEDQRLEARVVMSHAPFVVNQYLLTHPQIGTAYKLNKPQRINRNAPPYDPVVFNKGYVTVDTARGGSQVIVAQPDGSRFRISLSLADNQYPPTLTQQTGSQGTNVIPSAIVQARGTVRAYGMPGGKTGIIVDGNTNQMQLTIDPLPFAQRKGFAHSFAYGEAGRTHLLNIGSIQVNGGSIQAILGFHSADLSGPLTIAGGATVDRIALNSLQPGASIGVGGTLNTLDINQGINLDTGPGISIAGDLNLFNVGQNVNLSNGASIHVGRFAGITPQAPKGTGTGSNVLSLNQAQIGTGISTTVPSLSAYIQGNLVIGAGSVLSIASGIGNSSIVGTSSAAQPTPILINGQLNLATSIAQLQILNLVPSNSFAPVLGTILPNFVARNGVIIAGVGIVGPS